MRRLLLCLLIGMLPGMLLAADKGLVLDITGELDDATRNNVRILVAADRYACVPERTTRAFIARQVRQNSELALQAMGYFQPTLTLHWQRLTKANQCAVLSLHIEAGPATLISERDIRLTGDAADDKQFLQVIDNAGLVVGERLQQNRYDSLKQALQQLLIDRGYAEGELVAHRLEIDQAQQTARVVLHVDSGPRYRFGQIALAGDTGLEDNLLRDFLRFSSGEPFSQRQLLETQQAYLGTSYFSAVRMVRGEPDATQRTIDVTVRFSPRNRWALLSGIGVSTDTGPRLRLGVEDRRVNRFGHTARAEAKVSGVSQGVGTGYQIPLGDPVNEKLDLHTGYLNEETDTSQRESLNVGADYIVRTRSGWMVTPSLTYLKEVYAVADQISRARLVMPGFQLMRVKADDPIYPTRGWKAGFQVKGSAEPLWSTTRFVQYDLWGKLILPVPFVGGRLLARGQLAATQVSDIGELPVSLRFFAGGDSSVRGFAYQSLGPRNDNDEVIGGRDLLVGSVEYDYRVGRSWALALFSDWGNAFNDFSDYEVERSAGVGVRWISPLGPIRLDVARGLKADQGWRLHLSMGPDL